jgi:betaine-aldehyde dehydrogenase
MDELVRLLTDENGKTLADAKGELERGIGILEYYAGLAQNVFGKTSISSPDYYSFVMREPMGVVGAIIPWNFPAVLMLRAVSPALAAGNAVIVKPASYTPGINYAMIKIFSEIEEIPDGILSFVSGTGSIVGAELARSRDVDMIALTGSSETGKRVMQAASETLKKVSLELGGKSPNIVLGDANFDKAIRYALKGAWMSFGCQVCYAGTRILLDNAIHDRFVEALKEQAEGMKLGYGANKGVDIGPVISQDQVDIIMDYIDIGNQDAKLVTGGFRADSGDLAKGFFVAPTVFDDVPVESRLSQEEVFGPVLSVFRFDDVEEAAEIANNSQFGLAAAVWTQDINKALRLARTLKAGTVWINTYGRLPYQAEMGGQKESGIGIQYGEEGLNEFTQLKHIGIDIGD